MTKLKRPERCVNFESIKPELKEITEFYTRKVKDYLHCLKQLDEYADALENEISVLKETPKIEVLLDDIDKPLVVVPEDVDKAIKYLKTQNNFATITDLKKLDILTEKGFWWLNDFQFKDRRFGFGGLNNKLFILSHLAITGYTVEKEQLFYLKNKITQEYLYDNDGHFSECGKEALGFDMFKVEFTKSEIEDMQTGSYEQIEVKVEEVE